MKILLVGPKSLKLSQARFDMIVWNFLLPLKSLGHDVLFYDTILNAPDAFPEKVEEFKPDLIFCILTGDPNYGKFEPWEEIQKITDSGNITTFNWFCDDAWRFDNWSFEKCWYFTASSTTEPSCIEKYRELGYDNIFEANWHSNHDLYSIESCPKSYDISFTGALYGDRKRYLERIEKKDPALFAKIYHPAPCSFEKMVHIMNMSKICLSFAANPNGDNVKQMKGRMFEIPASQALLMTEYTDGLEKYYIPNKEAVFFENPEELISKLNKLLSKPAVLNGIASAGYDRYMSQHTSEKRLGELLEWIKSL